MGKGKRILIIVMCILSELSILLQMWKVNYFTGTSCLMKMAAGEKLGTHSVYFKSHIVTAVVMSLEFLAMLIFFISFLRNNRKGRLKTSYIVLLLHTGIMAFTSMMFQRAYKVENSNLKLNITVYFLSMLILGAVLVVFIMREQMGAHYGFVFSPVLLLVMVGLFSTNGLFGMNGMSRVTGILTGGTVILPYLTIFTFEKIVLEPSMKKYRY
ncbi:MAG: hypothetical protein K6G64_01230 [Eubacterium sp.]|nr:hypothetical protein [Eubacterium sp.]